MKPAFDRRKFLLSAGAATLAGPLSAQTATRRAFRMGATRWPPDLTEQAVAQVENFLRTQCDFSAPMILGGVPWTEALAGQPYSAALQAELAWRAPAGHQTLLSLSAMDMGRATLAPYYGQSDNQPVPAAFQGKAFDHPDVLNAYRNFALEASATRPDYLAIGVEVNLLLHNNPSLWDGYKRMHRTVYEAVKARYPRIKVCFTIEALHYLGLANGADAALQAREVRELLSHSDIVAFSLYPHMSWDVPRMVPDGYYDFMGALGDAVGKPVAVAESGMTSRRVFVSMVPLFGSEAAHAQHLRLLLNTAQRDRFAFVVNFASHDFEPLTSRLSGNVRQLAKIWTYTGILRSDGSRKPGSDIWEQVFNTPR